MSKRILSFLAAILICSVGTVSAAEVLVSREMLSSQDSVRTTYACAKCKQTFCCYDMYKAHKCTSK